MWRTGWSIPLICMLLDMGSACHCDPTHIQNGICTKPNTVAFKGRVRSQKQTPDMWESQYTVDVVEIFHDPQYYLEGDSIDLYVPDEEDTCVLDMQVGQPYYIEASYWGRFQTDRCSSTQPWPDDHQISEELRNSLHNIDCHCQVKVCENTIWPEDYLGCLTGILYHSQCLMDQPNSFGDCDVSYNICTRVEGICHWQQPLPDECPHIRGDQDYYDYYDYYQ